MAADTSSRHSPLIWLVFLVIVIDLVGFGLVIPLLPFMAPNLGGDSTDVAFIMITYALGAALVSPAWGSFQIKLTPSGACFGAALQLCCLCSDGLGRHAMAGLFRTCVVRPRRR